MWRSIKGRGQEGGRGDTVSIRGLLNLLLGLTTISVLQAFNGTQ